MNLSMGMMPRLEQRLKTDFPESSWGKKAAEER